MIPKNYKIILWYISSAVNITFLTNFIVCMTLHSFYLWIVCYITYVFCINYTILYYILWFLWNSFTRHMFTLKYHCAIHILSGINHYPPFTAKKLLYLSFIFLNADFIGLDPESDYCQIFFHVLLHLLISLSYLW